MKRFFGIGVVCALVMALTGALAGCGNSNDDSPPLAYVPTNTPYLIANLKPADKKTRKAMLDSANEQLPGLVAKLRQAGEALQSDGQSQFADFVSAMADEFDGKTYQDIAKKDGLRPGGLYAIYGLGLSPVFRLPIADAKKFNQFVQRFASKAGGQFQTDTLSGRTYRHISLGDGKLELLVAEHRKQAVIALLPAQASETMLGKVLGTDKPDKSIQTSGRLKKLAKSHGYDQHGAAYLDTTKLPALLTGQVDPFVKAITDERHDSALPKSCATDLKRVASRVPLVSLGYTTFKPKNTSMKLNIELASDITDALSGIKLAMPGMGAKTSAPLDITLGMPVSKLRQFISSQARAVRKNPFHCGAYKRLNRDFAELARAADKTALPPMAGLTGLRMSLQSIGQMTGRQPPNVKGAVIIGTRHPQGLVALASNFSVSLRRANPQKNGKAVRLQGGYASRIGQPLWIAMNDKAVGIAVGADEKGRLEKLLGAKTGKTQSAFYKVHVTGPMAEKLAGIAEQVFGGYMTASAQHSAGPDRKRDKQAARQFEQAMQNAKAKAKNLKAAELSAAIKKNGLVIDLTRTLR